MEDSTPRSSFGLVARGLAQPLVSPLIRFGRSMRTYDRSKARADVVAGLTVSVIAVPQAMAYAIIAGVRPEYGLYTVIFQCLIGSIFNSQPLLSVGPINTQSLLVASIVTRVVSDLESSGGVPPETLYLQLVIALTFAKGVMQMALAEARLGNLVRYVSQGVVVGFTAGAGVLIAAGQIPNFLGVEAPRVEGAWPGLVGLFQRLAPVIDQTHWQAVLLGVAALVLVVGCRMISRMLPGPLLAVGITALVVYLLGWTGGEASLVGEIPYGLPAPTLPSVRLIGVYLDSMMAGALALSLLGLMEAYSIGKSIAAKTGDRISANQEMFSQGLTNFVSSFFSCIPGSGSFSRSALNHYAGAQTAMSGIFNALFVLAIFLLFAPAAKYIPMTAIAAILFVVAFGLIDWRYFVRVWHAHPSEALVCMGTFLATLFVPLKYAVFVGIALNLALYLRRTSQLHLFEMVRAAGGGPMVERPLRTRTDRPVVLLQVEGDLFFGLADELQDRLTDLTASPVRAVILRLKRTHSIDATVMGVLESFIATMHERGRHVLLCGVRPDLIKRMTSFGVIRLIGEDNVFPTGLGVFASTKRALKRAEELVGSSIDVDGYDIEDDPADDEPPRGRTTLTYDI